MARNLRNWNQDVISRAYSSKFATISKGVRMGGVTGTISTAIAELRDTDSPTFQKGTSRKKRSLAYFEVKHAVGMAFHICVTTKCEHMKQ